MKRKKTKKAINAQKEQSTNKMSKKNAREKNNKRRERALNAQKEQ